MTVAEDAADTVPDLSGVFADIDDLTLTLTVQGNSNSSLVNTSVNGTNLTLSYAAGLFVEDTFHVTVNAAPTIPTGNMVLEMKFDGDAGDTSPDGATHNGTLQNGATTVTDATRGNVASFDGTDDRITVGNHADLNKSTIHNYSISLWFHASDTNGRQVLYEQGGQNRGFNIYLDGAELYVGTWGMSGAADAFLSTTIAAGQWRHVAVRFDSSGSLRACLDGVEFGSASAGSVASHSGRVGIGRVNGRTRFHDGSSALNANAYSGLIDDLRIYRRTLSLLEVETLSLF